MGVVVSLIGCVAALVLIAAAFMYVFDPGQALKLLKKALLLPLGLLLGLELLAALAREVGACCMGVFLLLMSLAAYAIREKLIRRPERPRKQGRGERTPLVPRGGQAK
jgi:hypothetical protein